MKIRQKISNLDQNVKDSWKWRNLALIDRFRILAAFDKIFSRCITFRKMFKYFKSWKKVNTNFHLNHKLNVEKISISKNTTNLRKLNYFCVKKFFSRFLFKKSDSVGVKVKKSQKFLVFFVISTIFRT